MLRASPYVSVYTKFNWKLKRDDIASATVIMNYFLILTLFMKKDVNCSYLCYC